MSPRLYTSVENLKSDLLDRLGAVIVVPVYNSYDDVVRCLESLVRHSPAEADVLIVDDVGADRRLFDLLASLLNQSGPRISVLQREINGGFVGACNSAFESAGQRDVILVNSDVVVGDGDGRIILFEGGGGGGV